MTEIEIQRIVDYFRPTHRITKGRELDSLVAQVIYGWYPCGCGNPACDLFGNPEGGAIEPFPNYSEEDYRKLLAFTGA